MRRTTLAAVIAALACASAASASDEPELLPSHDSSHDVLLASAMMPSHDTSDLRFAAVPGGTIDDVLLGAFPLRPEDFETALPPPPQKVTLENSYAPVVFSHAGHLSRRTPCRACHGEGPVRRIGRFQPKVAHDTCRKCHLTVAKGPTDCRGCHHVKPKATELVESGPPDPRKQRDLAAHSANQVVLPASVAMLTPGAPLPYSPDTATASYETASAWPAPHSAGPAPAEPSLVPDPLAAAPRRSVLAGASALAGTGTATIPAASVQVAIRQEGLEISESLDWGSGARTRRALGLVGLGVVRPIRPQWCWKAAGVAGFDAVNVGWTAFLPAVGLRAGVEWASPRPFLHTIGLSVTALADASRARDPGGASIGGGVLSFSISAGMDLTRRR